MNFTASEGNFLKKISILSGDKINCGMISEALQLDRISYDDVYQLQVDTCLDYFAKNHDIYIMAVDCESDTVVGYINFSPVRESVYADLASGSVVDTVITSDDVLPYEAGNDYWGYFSSIVVHPEYRHHGVAVQMILYWSDLMVQLAEKCSIYFKSIVADAVSDIGAHLLSEIGFSFVRMSMHKTKIMTLDLFSDDVLQSKFNKNLLAAYREYRERKGKSDAL